MVAIWTSKGDGIILLSQAVHLVVNKPVARMSDVEAYLVNKLVEEWRHSYDQATSDSHRGNLRLEQYLHDADLTVENMHEDLLNVEPYGLWHIWVEG